jgi:hypothetical protein
MHIDLTDEWYGHRIRGRFLVDPNGQRITPERLAGLMWRDAAELRLAGFESRRRAEAENRAKQYGPRVRVVVIELAEFRANGCTVA